MTMTQSSQNQASKALAEMYNSNTDYIQRLKEIISLNQLVQMQAEDMAGIELIGKPKYLASLCSTNHHALQHWLDDLEQWQDTIDKTEPQYAETTACCVYDDYGFYQDHANDLKNIAVMVCDQVDELKRHNPSHDFQLLNHLTSVIKRLAVNFFSDLEAELDVLSQLYPDLFMVEV